MKKNATHYMTVGSSALKNEPTGHIIEFPSRYLNEVYGQHVKEPQRLSFFTRIKNAILKTQSMQDLHYGSLKGRSLNRVKPWQSALATTGFFLAAMACVYFGA